MTGTHARRIARQAKTHANALGVHLVVEHQEEQRRLTFHVERTDGEPGNGARAIRKLLELADEAAMPVAIDVLASSPQLIRYYHQFGFRAFSEAEDPQIMQAEEEAGIAEIERERAAHISESGGTSSSYDYVTFMWRDIPGATT